MNDTSAVNENVELEKLILNLLGIPTQKKDPVLTTTTPKPADIKPRPKTTSLDVNPFGSRIGEEREVVIKYKVGHERDAEVVINGDAHRCMEDSLAAAFGLGRLVQASTSRPDISCSEHCAISHHNVGQKILDAILDSLTEAMLESISSIAKVVRGS